MRKKNIQNILLDAIEISAKLRNKMVHLIYYYKEKTEWFPEAFKKQMTRMEAEIVFRKLCRHFKLDGIYSKVNLYWVSGNRCPKAYGVSAVKLNIDCNDFGRLCHELAHIAMCKKYHKMGHNKIHKKIMKKMINYCKRKNWFENELNRRMAPKPEKPELTKDEIRQQKILKLEKAIKRHQTRIKRCENAIKKANRRISSLRRFI